ncbi:hypothetical protein [Kordia sp.]|uniref:hypothetical protein n=1 Tax=Kordia sp. TaxID=1965332 RepID=UPI003D6B2867
MDYIKSKSEFNLAAAKVLIDDQDNFAPSVHCSYYGCLQFIKSKLHSLGIISYSQMSEDIAKSKQGGMRALSSHKYPLDLIVKAISEKENLIYAKKINDKVKELKTFRIMSDYHNVEIDKPKSMKALALSCEVISLIKSKL